MLQNIDEMCIQQNSGCVRTQRRRTSASHRVADVPLAPPVSMSSCSPAHANLLSQNPGESHLQEAGPLTALRAEVATLDEHEDVLQGNHPDDRAVGLQHRQVPQPPLLHQRDARLDAVLRCHGGHRRRGRHDLADRAEAHSCVQILLRVVKDSGQQPRELVGRHHARHRVGPLLLDDERANAQLRHDAHHVRHRAATRPVCQGLVATQGGAAHSLSTA